MKNLALYLSLFAIAGAAQAATVPASSIRRELSADVNATREKYQGTPVSISGFVHMTYTGYGNSGRPAVKLGTVNDDLVLCFLDAPSPFHAGQQATVEGTVDTVSDTFVGDGLRIESCSIRANDAAPAPQPMDNPASQPQPQPQPAPQPVPGPAITVSAMTLFKSLGNTPLMDTYQGKTLRVIGALGPVSASDASIVVPNALTAHAVTCDGVPDPAVATRGRGAPVVATGTVSRIFHGSTGYYLLSPCVLTSAN